MSEVSYTLRRASLTDVDALEALIARSARALSRDAYEPRQVEAALRGAFERRDAAELDPATDAARIRAFFVHPAFARQGIAGAILDRCEGEAVANGFSRLELVATLPGTPFYLARGYVRGVPLQHDLGNGLNIEFVSMSKSLAWQRATDLRGNAR